MKQIDIFDAMGIAHEILENAESKRKEFVELEALIPTMFEIPQDSSPEFPGFSKEDLEYINR